MSWIACGKDKIDLPKAMEILFKEFEVKNWVLLEDLLSIRHFWMYLL